MATRRKHVKDTAYYARLEDARRMWFALNWFPVRAECPHNAGAQAPSEAR